jgi:hypothetical protein
MGSGCVGVERILERILMWQARDAIRVAAVPPVAISRVDKLSDDDVVIRELCKA